MLVRGCFARGGWWCFGRAFVKPSLQVCAYVCLRILDLEVLHYALVTRYRSVHCVYAGLVTWSMLGGRCGEGIDTSTDIPSVFDCG